MRALTLSASKSASKSAKVPQMTLPVLHFYLVPMSNRSIRTNGLRRKKCSRSAFARESSRQTLWFLFTDGLLTNATAKRRTLQRGRRRRTASVRRRSYSIYLRRRHARRIIPKWKSRACFVGFRKTPPLMTCANCARTS